MHHSNASNNHYRKFRLKAAQRMLNYFSSPPGVTEAHMLDWIHNGPLPLIDAFPLLTREEQGLLKQIKYFFKSKSKI